ncbi:hypothetical protein PF003_g11917 [Phytophthora fragariae]|nr:hypothetical protein PF003_g11917 [Phytophthora fragariae]
MNTTFFCQLSRADLFIFLLFCFSRCYIFFSYAAARARAFDDTGFCSMSSRRTRSVRSLYGALTSSMHS